MANENCDAPKPGDSEERIAIWVKHATKDERYEWMMNVNCRQLAADIKGLRLRSGLTQRQLADGLGTSASTICMWESGAYQGYTIQTLIRIAAYFDVAFVCRFVGWPEFIVSTANGVTTLPLPFAQESTTV